MTMRVVFLKDYGEYNDKYKVLDEVFIPRNLGQKLCFQEIAIPAYEKEKHPEYKKLIRLKKAKERAAVAGKIAVKKKAEEAKKAKLLKEKEEADREKAIPKIVKKRTKAIKK